MLGASVTSAYGAANTEKIPIIRMDSRLITSGRALVEKLECPFDREWGKWLLLSGKDHCPFVVD